MTPCARRKPGPSRVLRFVFIFAVLAALIPACTKSPVVPGSGPQVLGVEELVRLDQLPRLKSCVEVGCVSSWDRSGGNDDGFSGKSSFIRKEPGGLVIADLQGPGIITRIHTPSPTEETMEFFFDGEPAPRISLKVTEMFDGRHAPFLAPLVGAGVGGRYSYVPLTYRTSCKIMVKAETFHFIQINYARFAPDADIPTFENPPTAAFRRAVEKAARLFASAGEEISADLVPAGTRLERREVRGPLAPGGSLTVFETSSPGRVVGLRIGPADALAGKDRDILIRMTWDGSAEPAVLCPAGDFFGASFGDPAVRSLFLGTSGAEDYVYFPMPFERSARIELVSERASGPPLDIRSETVFAPLGKAADEGRFYARWHRENPTRDGVPFTYLKTTGRGHVVGVILQAQGLKPGETPFFEGDDRAVIDGRLAIPGTGSEDSFNGGWYDVPGRWDRRASYPLSGCLDYKKPLGRTGGYRWLVTDSYAYRESIDFTIEHGPEGNLTPTDYTGVVFFYSAEPPPAGEPLPAVADRRVADPERVVFVPGWTVPIHSFSLRNAVLEKLSEKAGDERVRALRMTTHGEDIFGPHHVSFICDLPSAGLYAVSLKAVRGPDQGIVRVYRNDVPAGVPEDLYAPAPSVSEPLPLGTFDFAAGENVLFLTLVGKNVRASGLGMELVEIVFERTGKSVEKNP
jgi:hypothetical protein